MNQSRGLTYSDEALITKHKFVKFMNNINFFIEDTDKEYEYETILKKIFGEVVSFNRIFPCGGKKGVIKAFYEYGTEDNDNTKVKNFYIVDGDYDFIINSNEMIISDHFIYLEYYNIENYLLDIEKVKSFVKGYLQCLDQEIDSYLNFGDWEEKMISEAIPLFSLYIFIQLNFPHIKNVSNSSFKYLDNETGFKKQGSNIYDEIIEEIISLNPANESKLEEHDKIYFKLIQNFPQKTICGKFILDSLLSFMNSSEKMSRNVKKEDLRWYLINNINIEKFEFLRIKVFSNINN